MAPRIFFHTFSMALYQKWDVKNDFAYVLQFFSLISDSLGSVSSKPQSVEQWIWALPPACTSLH